MTARLLRSGLTLLAAFVVVWIAVIVWWQSTNRMPSTADIVTYLFLLPLGMVIGYWVIKRALDGIRSNVAAGRELSAAVPAAAVSDGTPADTQDATRHWRAVLLASALRAPGGSDAASLVDAVQASTQPCLTDVQGFGQPVFAAPVDGLDIEDLRTELAERYPGMEWLDEHLRALTLAGQVAEELAAHAVAQHPEPAAAGAEATRLIVTALLPREWTPQQQAAADAWLRQRIGVIWPADHLTLEPITAKGDADALLLLDRATQAVNRTSDERVLRMLVVADSLVGPSAVEQLTQQEQLFEANRQHGRVPGEAAAGVLLCAPALATAQVKPAAADVGDETPAAPITITRASVARLEAPTPDRGQPQLEVLGGAVRHVLETLASAPGDTNGKTLSTDKAPAATDAEPAVASVVTDTGMHPVRTVEVARVFSERFPKLDVAADLLPLGTPCGYVGAAGALLPVVVAHQLSQQSGKPVLAITANDIQQRGAIAVVPSLT